MCVLQDGQIDNKDRVKSDWHAEGQWYLGQGAVSRQARAAARVQSSRVASWFSGESSSFLDSDDLLYGVKTP